MATNTITVHRHERRPIGVGFTPDVPAGPTFSSVELIEFLDAAGVDKTSEFRGASPSNPVINRLRVDVWKEIAPRLPACNSWQLQAANRADREQPR